MSSFRHVCVGVVSTLLCLLAGSLLMLSGAFFHIAFQSDDTRWLAPAMFVTFLWLGFSGVTGVIMKEKSAREEAESRKTEGSPSQEADSE